MKGNYPAAFHKKTCWMPGVMPILPWPTGPRGYDHYLLEHVYFWRESVGCVFMSPGDVVRTGDRLEDRTLLP